MFGWFRSKAESPIDIDTERWINGRWKWLEAEFGTDALRTSAVILPDFQYFPEPYHGNPEDAGIVFDRVCRYMRLDPAQIALYTYENRPDAAGLYTEVDGVFHVGVDQRLLQDALTMVATMAHELSHVHLLGHRRVSESEPDHEPLADLLTVYMGLGVFTANAVVMERAWSSATSWEYHHERRGYTTMTAYGYALARFARARNEQNPRWARSLRPDVRGAFHQATRYLTEQGDSLPM